MIARVYGAINAITAELATSGIAKERLNARDNYFYRSIDDVLVRLSPLLAKHKICILPRVLERSAAERQGEDGQLLLSVVLKVAFDFVSVEDGSTHTMQAFGEALDMSDKGTNKAMQSAYKYAVLQAFCVPGAHGDDADAVSHRLNTPQLRVEPEQGWAQWTQGLEEAIAACSTPDALQRQQEECRELLTALRRENPELYSQVGRAIVARRAKLSSASQTGSPAPRTKVARQKGTAQAASCPKRTRSPKPNGSAVHA